MNTYQATLRDQLIARCNRPVEPTPLEIPLAGLIAPDLITEIQQLAQEALAGKVQARDRLYESFRKRLNRMGYVVRPWPDTLYQTGIWERDDVNQEGWIVFAELLNAWNGDVPFVNYLFARFPWRLRDRMLRGIGKPMPPIGTTQVPEYLLESLIAAGDDEQPESAFLAAGLLEEIINRALGSDGLTTLHSPERGGSGNSNQSCPPLPKVKAA